MNSIVYEDENLCSIGRLNSKFQADEFLRDVLRDLLDKSCYVIASIQRPYSIATRPRSFDALEPFFEKIEHDEEWFSITFEYVPALHNNNFFEFVRETWHVYEQPVYVFLSAAGPRVNFPDLKPLRNMTWKSITQRCRSVVLFKSIEEDVYWFGKSDEMQFDFLDGSLQ